MVIAMVVFIDTAFAQTYSIIPNDTFKISGMMEDQQTLTISQLNTSNSTMTLKWEKISESVPANWEASVCDNKVCYVVLEDSGTMNPIAPNESGFLLLHIVGHVNFGTALIRYKVWDMNNPMLKDTLTYILTIDKNTALAETDNRKTFIVFPNPAKGQINVESGFHKGFIYSFMNATGQEVCTGYSDQNSMVFSTENFPKGIYILKLSSNDDRVNNKFFIQKIIIQ